MHLIFRSKVGVGPGWFTSAVASTHLSSRHASSRLHQVDVRNATKPAKSTKMHPKSHFNARKMPKNPLWSPGNAQDPSNAPKNPQTSHFQGPWDLPEQAGSFTTSPDQPHARGGSVPKSENTFNPDTVDQKFQHRQKNRDMPAGRSIPLAQHFTRACW